MSYQLQGPRRMWSTNTYDWQNKLKRAHAHGWEPAGTIGAKWYEIDENGNEIEIETGDWDGNYWSNNHQCVDYADAAAIATALEQSLEDTPVFSSGDVERYLAWRALDWESMQAARDAEKRVSSATRHQLADGERESSGIAHEILPAEATHPLSEHRLCGLALRRLKLQRERDGLLLVPDPARVQVQEWIDSRSEVEREVLDIQAFVHFLREGSFGIG